MSHISCKIKHCIQNITNTSQKQTFANTFAIILISVRFVCVLNREKCVAKSVLWNWNWVKGWWLVYGFADLVCGSGVWAFRNSVTSKDFLCKQCKQKTVKCKKKKIQRLQWNITRFALIILIYLDFLEHSFSLTSQCCICRGWDHLSQPCTFLSEKLSVKQFTASPRWRTHLETTTRRD